MLPLFINAALQPLLGNIPNQSPDCRLPPIAGDITDLTIFGTRDPSLVQQQLIYLQQQTQPLPTRQRTPLEPLRPVRGPILRQSVR